MKKITLLFFAMAVFMAAFAQDPYYWYQGKKIPLTTDNSVLYLRYAAGTASIEPTRARLASVLKLNVTKIKATTDSEYVISSAPGINPATLLQAEKNLQYTAFLLRSPQGTMTVLPGITLQLKKGNTIDELLARYGKSLSLLRAGRPNRYTLRVHLNSGAEVLRLSNEIVEKSGLVDWCEPLFYSELHKTDDPLYPDQYYLKNTGSGGGTSGIDINVEPAWCITKGSSTVRVAVIDEGVEDHEDLSGRVLSGYTAGVPLGVGAPINSGDGHGVACAGIIAASHNNLDIKGIAPNVLIVPINIFASGVSSGDIADAINWAWDPAHGAADVLSNSWTYATSSSAIDAAISDARTLGRVVGSTALGCPVVFASGNSGSSVVYPGNVAGVITVGAIDRSGSIWSYSSTGSSMDLVAPSGALSLTGDLYTLDRMGTNGYETGNYTARFGGTSAACPQVSGVAALMLSVNPALTEAQVKSILQNTATDMGTTGFDNTYGYGRVDATAAVRGVMATLAISGNDVVCSTSGTYSIPYIPSGATVAWTVSPTGVATVNSPSSSTTTLTKVTSGSSGAITLTATITPSCGSAVVLTKLVRVGAPFYYTYIKNFTTDGTTTDLGDCNRLITPIGNSFYNGYIDVTDAVATSYTWTFIGKTPSTASVNLIPNPDNQHLEIRLKPQGATASYKLTRTNACGSDFNEYGFTADAECNVSRMGPGAVTGLDAPVDGLTVSPNPASTSVTVTLQQPAKGQRSAQPLYLAEVKIYDAVGKLVAVARPTNALSVTLPLNGAGNGIYMLQIRDNTGRVTTRKLSVKK